MQLLQARKPPAALMGPAWLLPVVGALQQDAPARCQQGAEPREAGWSANRLPGPCGVPVSHWNLEGRSFWKLRLQDPRSAQEAFASLCAVLKKLGLRPALLLRNALCLRVFALWQLLARLVWRLCDAQQCLKRHRARLPAQQLLDLRAAELLLLLRHLAVQVWAARQRLKRHCCCLPARRLRGEQEVGVCAKPQASFPASLGGAALQDSCLRCWQNVCLEQRPVLLRLVQPCWARLAVCHCSALPVLGCSCCW